jgi:hypothetical protein
MSVTPRRSLASAGPDAARVGWRWCRGPSPGWRGGRSAGGPATPSAGWRGGPGTAGQGGREDDGGTKGRVSGLGMEGSGVPGYAALGGGVFGGGMLACAVLGGGVLGGRVLGGRVLGGRVG